MQHHLMCILSKQSDWHRLAPVMTYFKEQALIDASLSSLKWSLVYTGSAQELESDLGLEHIELCLGVEHGSVVMQMAKTLASVEPVLEQLRPSAVLVTSDTHTALAVAMAAYQKQIPVIYLNAKSSSSNGKILETMSSLSLFTDEHEMVHIKDNKTKNAQHLRVVKKTDASSITHPDLHSKPNPITQLTSLSFNERNKKSNKKRVWVGNTLACHVQAHPLKSLVEIEGLAHIDEESFSYGYIVVSIHHPEVIDKPILIQNLMKTFGALSMAMPIVMIVNSKLKDKLNSFKELIELSTGFYCVDTLPYQDFLSLIKNSSLVMTDGQSTLQECQMLEVPTIDLLKIQDLKVIMKSVQCHLSDNELCSSDNQTYNPAACFSHKASHKVVDNLITFFNLKIEEFV